jgi:hypothetical protein
MSTTSFTSPVIQTLSIHSAATETSFLMLIVEVTTDNVLRGRNPASFATLLVYCFVTFQSYKFGHPCLTALSSSWWISPNSDIFSCLFMLSEYTIHDFENSWHQRRNFSPSICAWTVCSQFRGLLTLSIWKREAKDTINSTSVCKPCEWKQTVVLYTVLCL